MAHIPRQEIERLQQEISLQCLVEAQGIELQRQGVEFLGSCPFHSDSELSLVVCPQSNEWRCRACQTGGSVIDWVRKCRGVSFRHAVEMLRNDHPALAAAAPVVSKGTASAVKLEMPFTPGSEDRQLLRQVSDHYHETLKESPEALKYLLGRGLQHPDMLAHFRLGFANRTLGYRLPDKNRKSGADIRGRLQRLGILRDSGHEHFSGSVVIPVLDLHGDVSQIYGRKITSGLRTGTPLHTYLPGPCRGVWNEEALLVSKEIILCQSLIDALTFWCAELRHVTASYGLDGFTDEHRSALKKHGTKKVLIAYNRSDAGDKACNAVAEELMNMGIDCYRVLFPRDTDVNQYSAGRSLPAEIWPRCSIRRNGWAKVKPLR